MPYAAPSINPANKGLLHEKLGIGKDKKISMGTLMAAKSRAKRSGDTKLEREATFASNAKGWKH